jgi:hypothetical protein
MHPGALLLALLSAALSYLVLLFFPTVPIANLDAGDLVPGLIFGLLVLAARPLGTASIVFLVVLSAFVHLGAHEMALTLHAKSWPIVLACAIPGLLAAFVLSVACSRLTHQAAAWRNNLRSAALGGGAGLLIGMALEARQETMQHALLFSGYALWQVGFALANGVVPRWWRSGTPAAAASPPT